MSILEIIIRAIVTFVCLVLGCRHTAFIFSHFEKKHFGMVGSHVMLTAMWILLMARAILV